MVTNHRSKVPISATIRAINWDNTRSHVHCDWFQCNAEEEKEREFYFFTHLVGISRCFLLPSNSGNIDATASRMFFHSNCCRYCNEYCSESRISIFSYSIIDSKTQSKKQKKESACSSDSSPPTIDSQLLRFPKFEDETFIRRSELFFTIPTGTTVITTCRDFLHSHLKWHLTTEFITIDVPLFHSTNDCSPLWRLIFFLVLIEGPGSTWWQLTTINWCSRAQISEFFEIQDAADFKFLYHALLRCFLWDTRNLNSH